MAGRFPAGMLTPKLVKRAVDPGLFEPLEDGRFRVPDSRFLDTGAALVELGIPAVVVLEEWETLSGLTELAGVLARLRSLANTVVLASLDASVSKVGSRRLAALLPPEPSERPERPS